MKHLYGITLLLPFCVLPGCTGDAAKRLTYDALQTREQIECQRDLTAVCPGREPYDAYQQQRDELLFSK